MVVSYLLDDNDAPCSPIVPIAGTRSESVAREMMEKVIEKRNLTTTLVYDKEVRRVLPGLIPEPLDSKILADVLEPADPLSRIQSFVDM